PADDALQALALAGAAIVVGGEEGGSVDRGLPQGHNQITRHDVGSCATFVVPGPPRVRHDRQAPRLGSGRDGTLTQSVATLPLIGARLKCESKGPDKTISQFNTLLVNFSDWTNES